MQIDKNTVAPGVWSVSLTPDIVDLYSEILDQSKENQILFCKSIGAMLDLEYVDHVIYDYKYVLEQGNITAGPSLWHSDGNGRFDCQLMTYIVDPEINAETGMRVGFRNSLTQESHYMNISRGTSFLARQDLPEYQHHVEPKRRNITQRVCFTICFQGLNKLGIV